MYAGAAALAADLFTNYLTTSLTEPLKFCKTVKVVNIQVGYCMSDIISKCGVGLIIYQVSYAKSAKEGLLPQ